MKLSLLFFLEMSKQGYWNFGLWNILTRNVRIKKFEKKINDALIPMKKWLNIWSFLVIQKCLQN